MLQREELVLGPQRLSACHLTTTYGDLALPLCSRRGERVATRWRQYTLGFAQGCFELQLIAKYILINSVNHELACLLLCPWASLRHASVMAATALSTKQVARFKQRWSQWHATHVGTYVLTTLRAVVQVVKTPRCLLHRNLPAKL